MIATPRLACPGFTPPHIFPKNRIWISAPEDKRSAIYRDITVKKGSLMNHISMCEKRVLRVENTDQFIYGFLIALITFIKPCFFSFFCGIIY